MRVFMSYAETDRDWARRLTISLRKSGLDVLDPYAEAFPGDNLHLALGKALERAGAIVFVISPSLRSSGRMSAELQYALVGSQFEGRVWGIVRSRKLAPIAPGILRHLKRLIVARDPAAAARRLAEEFRGQRGGRGSRAHAAS